MRLAEARAMIRRNLSGAESDWSEELLDGALNRAIDDLNRVAPLEKVKDFTLNFGVTSENWTTDHDVAVQLVNKRLKPSSETVKIGTTKYIRDTDYTIDYIDGKVTALSSGGMADATAATIDYTKLQVYVDISSLTDLIRVVRAEYPSGEIPGQFGGFYTWADFLILTSKGTESQQALTEESHIWIYYHAIHIVPDIKVESSWAPQLDEVVIKGSEAYSLLTKSLELRHSVRGRLVASLTTLQEVDAIAAKITTALDNTAAQATSASADLGDITARLSEMVATLASVGISLASAGDNIDKARTQAAIATTDIGKIDTPLTNALSRVDVVNALITRISALADNAQSHATLAVPLLIKAELDLGLHRLSKVDGHLDDIDGLTSGAGEILTIGRQSLAASSSYFKSRIDNLISLVAAAIISPTDSLQVALSNAGTALSTGDPLINKVNIGETVSDIYRRYAATYTEIARLRYDTWSVWVEQMDRHLAQGEGLVRQGSEYRVNAEAILRQADIHLGEITGLLGQATGYQNNSRGYTDAANNRALLGQVDVGAANAEVGNSGRVIEQANTHIAIGRLRLDAAQTSSNLVNAYIAAAAQHIGVAQARISEANARRTPIDAILERSARKIDVARILQQEAERRIQELGLKQSEVDRELAIAAQESELSDKFEDSGIRIKGEFVSILTDKSQVRADSTLTATRQQAPGSN